MDDQVGGKGISNDLANTTATSPVSVEGGRTSIAMPQLFEKALSITVEFDGGKLKATGKDLFIDYWEKVDWESKNDDRPERQVGNRTDPNHVKGLARRARLFQGHSGRRR